ncbi:MAG TPA: ribosome small subunit-dependent GTPase A [bacterium]|nr:ribosome small subunit-dependent GTPase A [bacterium]
MQTIPKNLVALGFDQRFQQNITLKNTDEFEIARVTVVQKNSYVISDGESDVFAELIGKMLYSAESSLDYPTVGDWVLAQFHNQRTFALIHDLLPRISLLKRKTPGNTIDFQLIAANIDTALIIQSLDEDFNLRRLERYLAMVSNGGVQPVVGLSKSDLVSSEQISHRTDEIKASMPHLEIIPFSNLNEEWEQIRDWLHSGRTYCLLGSSGVGKTMLLNNLIGDSVFAVKEVRTKDGKGRHATTSRQLIQLESGAMIIDTPGMRELGIFSVEAGIEATFPEIVTLARSCKFKDCTHVHETDCAVLEALETGQLSENRYRNYQKMMKESAYYEMSYVEKRRKDKEQGKFYKQVMQHKKNRK